MKLSRVAAKFDNIETDGHYSVPVTVHLGGDQWEDVVDIVYCQECNQVHIISEKLSGNSSRKR